ncbi:hypothetical protein [Clostridium sp. AWRP]|uniref:hypothetical protein n=1 Tax=Clostridium sp. AWRP TaxID=2212991 RepID=UPI000FDA00E5|nr:hypothetical protein [Clostridium sp. AWRP]AZV55936.1 hypothetical protein DMR38_04585 [Clostridium sp. AWRP]
MDNELLKALGNLLDEKLKYINDDIKEIKSDISGIKNDIELIRIQQKEHGAILRILEDKANTNKAEHDKLSNDMIQLSGKVEDMRKDLATVEVVTARNMENIASLKIIK